MKILRVYFGQYQKKAPWISSPSFLRLHEMATLGELASLALRVEITMGL